jgi:hypothetical protein
MNGIQILLICGVVIILVYYIMRFRNAIFDLLLLLFFSVLAIFFILFPDYTNTIAHKLGVGRGADLLFYLCILFSLFIILKLFARIRRLEETITNFVRKEAKDGAVLMDTKNKNDDN